jgi:signal transduction histidine kinase
MTRNVWTLALAGLFVALLAWYLYYTGQIRRSLRENSVTVGQMFAEVQQAIATNDPDVSVESLFRLQEMIIDAGVPLIVTDADGDLIIFENLPFEVDASTPQGQGRVVAYAEILDLTHSPVTDFSGNVIHFGDPAQARRLRWVPWLNVSGLVLTALLGLMFFRAQRRAEAERAWTSMARELAHQLGTPLSSLQGWLEVLSLPPGERPGNIAASQIASEIGEDLERLERVTRRFELIGRAPKLEPLDLLDLLTELERYFQARLPKLGQGVVIERDVPPDLPNVQGNRVLLLWAFENILKNSLDALAGSGGSIRISARPGEGKTIDVRISDDGPGVAPEVRDRIFEPGVTTKSSGWGVGLALAQRIVRGVHGGRIILVETAGKGATFLVKLPRADG